MRKIEASGYTANHQGLKIQTIPRGKSESKNMLNQNVTSTRVDTLLLVTFLNETVPGRQKAGK